MVLFFSVVSDVFRSPDNLLEILRSSAITSILVLGLTWIVATGEIDLSFPETAAFTSIVTAYVVKAGMPCWGLPWPLPLWRGPWSAPSMGS